MVVAQYRLLHARGHHDDAAEHRQERVPEREQPEPRIARRGCGIERAFGARVFAVEVQPPQRGREREAEHRRHDHTGREIAALHPHSDGHDGFAQCDQHDRAVALDKVLRPQAEPADRGDRGRDPVQDERGGPQSPARTALPSLERRNIPVCTAVTTRYPTPNAIPESPNACGTASATTRKPAMPTSMSNRSAGPSGGTALVSHA